MTDTDRRAGATTIEAAFVLGIEDSRGTLTIGEFQTVVERLQRAVRPWDEVVAVAPRAVGVRCTALTNAREVDAVAARLADVVRAPMAVGDDVRTLAVCVGSATFVPGEPADAAFDRARAAMQAMRTARAGLLAPEVPGQRGDIRLPH